MEKKRRYTIEDVIRLIAMGEGEEVEFKARPEKIAETVCAMANSRGGFILIGVDDKGKILGVDVKGEEKIVSELQGLMPSPRVSIHKINVNNKRVILIRVEKSKRFITLGNIAYVRIGRSNRALDIEELAVASVEELHVTFDSLPSDVPVKYLSKKLVEEYVKLREKTRGISPRGSLEDNLKRLKIVKGKYLTIAGVLFFTRNPQEFLPWTGIRIIELYPDGETKEIEEFTGPVWRLIDRVYGRIMEKIPRRELRPGARREIYSIYPEDAIREAITNAVAHRNYRIRSDIRIFIEPERLIIKNPGSFPPGVHPEDPEHIPRNPLICQFLYDMGYIEKYGFGIIKMKKSVNQHPFSTLEFKLSPMKTEVIFSTKEKEINAAERTIIALVKENPLSSQEIASHLGLSKVAVLKKLKKLMEMGVIKKTGKGKNTRYYS